MAADQNPPSFEFVDEGGHVRVRLAPVPLKIWDLERFKGQVQQILEKGARSLAFQFEGPTPLNSSFINLMVKAAQFLSQAGHPAFVISNDAEVLETLQMLDLDKIFAIHPGLSEYREALPKLGGSPS